MALRIVLFQRDENGSLSICDIQEPIQGCESYFSRRAFHQFRLGEIARVDMGRADAPLNQYITVADDMAEWCYAYKRRCPELDTPYVPGDFCTRCPFKPK